MSTVGWGSESTSYSNCMLPWLCLANRHLRLHSWTLNMDHNYTCIWFLVYQLFHILINCRFLNVLFLLKISYFTFVEKVVSNPFQSVLPPNGLSGGIPQLISEAKIIWNWFSTIICISYLGIFFMLCINQYQKWHLSDI